MTERHPSHQHHDAGHPDHHRSDRRLGVHEHDLHEHGPHGPAHHPPEGHGGVRGLISSILHPHSHDPSDSVDSVLEASAEGMRTLKISLVVLGITACLQVVIVVLSGSVALLADTIHNGADALTAVPLAVAFRLSRRPADHRYTYGYGRSEDLAGIFIVLTVAASAVVAAWLAIDRLIRPQPLHHVGWVIAAGLVGCIGNEAVAVYRIRTGRRIGSAALEADGYHARTDGLTSLAVVVGAIGVALGWQLADPIVGLVISVAILLVVKNAARDIYRRLMDSVDPALVEAIRHTLSDSEGIEGVETVRLRWVGHELYGEAEVVSNGGLTLAQAHQVAEQARHVLLHQVPHLSQITIHTSPPARDGVDPHALTEHHRSHLSVGAA